GGGGGARRGGRRGGGKGATRRHRRLRCALVRDVAFPRCPQPFGGREVSRVGEDRDDRAGEDQVTTGLRQQPEADAQAGEDEGELADLSETGRDRERRLRRISEGPQDDQPSAPV